MSYEKPPTNNVPFKFTSTGYVTPDFTGVPFRLGLRTSSQQTADMRATIETFGQYCETTYTYVKERKTYVVGYTRHGVQILRGKTVYGGIRDLCATLVRAPTHEDLSATLIVLENYLGLKAYIKSTFQSYADLLAETYGIPPSDLPAFIHGFDTREIPASIYGWAIKDLPGYIGAHPPADLTALLNVIEIRDLPGSITGEWWHGNYDLSAEFYRIWDHKPKNLGAFLHGWVEVDFPAYITAVYFKDLSASIKGSWIANLIATIYPIPPANLNAFLHGFDTRHIGSVINGVYGPYDLQAYLNVVPSNNLRAYINGFRGIQIPFNLKGIVEGWYTNDLPAYVNLVYPVDLNAYLMSVGKSLDLGAVIIPNTILMKRAIQIPLLEHKDLNALVNFMCFGSTYRELSAYLYAIHKLDLSAFIIGWYGSTADNVVDLGAYINTENYVVQDKFESLRYVPEVYKYSRLNLRFNSSDNLVYKIWNTIGVWFDTYYAKNLIASITGVPNSMDLGASLTPEWDWNYSELPEYVKPKTHEVFININRFEEQWKRFVEIMFDRTGTEPFKYFYVSGTQRVYRVDRSRHWTIWADGYSKTDGSMIERVNVRRKFIFNMSNYSTMDEAIRDLMTRAAYPNWVDMAAYINGDIGPHLDLAASVGIKRKYTWVKHLSASMTPIYMANLNAEIIGA